MQPAHQTFISVSLGTAILLGVAEVALAQPESTFSPYAPDQVVSLDLSGLASIPPLVQSSDLQALTTANVAAPEMYAIGSGMNVSEVERSLQGLEFSPSHVSISQSTEPEPSPPQTRPTQIEDLFPQLTEPQTASVQIEGLVGQAVETDGDMDGEMDADMMDGEMDADMMDGEMDADMMDGDMDADMMDGEMDADMMDGEMDADMMDGEMDGDMMDGDMDADMMDGEMDADMMDAEMDADMMDGEMDADMMDGEMDADMMDGEMDADMMDGDMMDGEMDGDMMDGEMDADMMDGEMDADMMDGEMDADMMDGEMDADMMDAEMDADMMDGDMMDGEEETSDDAVSDPNEPFSDDLADLLAEDEKVLIEVPDYLLSPTNPLFVPIEPTTVEMQGTQPISLEQALAIARRNSRELTTTLQQLEQSQEALREAKAAYLPTITGTSQLTHSDVDISNEPGSLQDGQPTVNTNLDIDLTVSYDIFTSGQRSANVRAAEEAVRLQELQIEVVKEDLRLSITSSYYDLQQTDELVRIAEDTVEQSRISLRDALARERAGVGTRFDRLQAEVDLANDEQNLSNALRDQQVTRRQLAELLSIPPGIDLSASDPVEVAGAWGMPLEETLVLAYRNRAELEQQLVQRDLEYQQKRSVWANRWPQLSIFGSYQLDDLLDVTRGGNDQEILSAGLQLQWTLYNGGATRAQARQEAIDAELAEIQFADTREDIRFEVEQQHLNLGSSFKNIQTANSAVGLAQESLRLARLRFGAGVGIQSDVLEAQTRLTEAEVNLVTAILDYNRALVAIQRAVSNFPDHNLSADPAREP